VFIRVIRGLSYVVIAPSLALLTVFAYFANTPRLNRGSGAFHFANLAAISASATFNVNVLAGISNVIVSPSCTAKEGFGGDVAGHQAAGCS